jgi:glycosyltransferase involved in cell wall biosynthesis
MTDLLLSVCLITYNHVKYINQAIDSILEQQTNFDWEIIIADDYSIDGTREILLDYQKKYPKLIRLILQEQNVGAARNWIDLITSPKAKYIAYFEGDDYWTDPLKLQKHVDFLEANPDYSAVTANTMFLNDGILKYNYTETKELWLKTKFPITLTYKDIASRIAPHTSTWLFRNNIKAFPPSFLNFYVGDMPLFLMICDMGKVRYFNEIVSVYRVHDNGAIGKIKKNATLINLRSHFEMLTEVNLFLNNKYKKETEYSLLEETYRVIKEESVFKNISEIKKILKTYLKKSNKNDLSMTEEMRIYFSYAVGFFIKLKSKLRTSIV